MDPELKQTLANIAQAIRVLSMDAVQKADSGHPGVETTTGPLGQGFGNAASDRPLA